MGAVRPKGIVPLVPGPRRELVDKREFLRRIRGGVDLRQRVVHFRPRLNGDVLADLLSEGGACRTSQQKERATQPRCLSHRHLRALAIGCILVPQLALRKEISESLGYEIAVLARIVRKPPRFAPLASGA